MMGLADEMERTGFLAHVEANSRIVCPNPACKAEFDGDQRIELMSTGRWLQPHTEWPPNGRVKGEAIVSAKMGFVINAFMEHFAKFHAIASDYALAMITLKKKGQDNHFREVFVKTLGEKPRRHKVEGQIR